MLIAQIDIRATDVPSKMTAMTHGDYLVEQNLSEVCNLAERVKGPPLKMIEYYLQELADIALPGIKIDVVFDDA